MAEPLSAEQTQQIESALATGRKIQAIKLYRQFTGQGLKESKEVIDGLGAELLRRDPVTYAALARTGKGCASLVVLGAGLAAAAGLAVVWFWRVLPMVAILAPSRLPWRS